jgi:RNA polymerase sigma-70 factor (ECF subfamily)
LPLTSDDIAALYRRHARTMLAFFARRTLDPDAALDLVAETFAIAIEQRARFRGRTDDEAAGWLYGIARHLVGGWYRRGAVERRAMHRLGIVHRDITEGEYDRVVELAGIEEARRLVAARLGDLDGAARLALRLRVVEERSYEEVAAALGVSEQTARARVSRALRGLAADLELDDLTGEVHARG